METTNKEQTEKTLLKHEWKIFQRELCSKFYKVVSVGLLEMVSSKYREFGKHETPSQLMCMVVHYEIIVYKLKRKSLKTYNGSHL